MAWRSTRRFRTNAPYFDFHTAVDRFADRLERGEGLVGRGLPLALGDLRGLCGRREAEEQRFPVGRLPHDYDAFVEQAA